MDTPKPSKTSPMFVLKDQNYKVTGLVDIGGRSISVSDIIAAQGNPSASVGAGSSQIFKVNEGYVLTVQGSTGVAATVDQVDASGVVIPNTTYTVTNVLYPFPAKAGTVYYKVTTTTGSVDSKVQSGVLFASTSSASSAVDPYYALTDSNRGWIGHAGRGGVRDNTVRKTERSIWETRGKAVVARAWYTNVYNLIPDPVGGIAANSFTITNAGAGYNNGTFPLSATAASGSGFTGTVTIAGGIVTAVTLTTKGSGYPAPAAGGVTFSISGAGTPTTAAIISGSTQYTIGTTTFANAGIKVYSAPSFEDVLTYPNDLTGHGAVASGVVQFSPTTLTVSASGRRSYIASNWFDVTQVARTDGGEGGVLVHDLYISTNGWVGCMGDGVTDDATKFITRKNRRRAFILQAGDACTTPSLFTATQLQSQAICVGIEYMTLGELIRNVWVSNDSIPEGRVPGLYGEGFVMEAADEAERLTGVKYEVFNASWSGIASSAFHGFFGDISDPSTYTGLNTNTPLGVYPSIIAAAIGTPNDYTYDGSGVSYTLNATQIAKNASGYGHMERRAAKFNIPLAPYNISPVDDTVKNYGTTGSFYENYNASFLPANGYKGKFKVSDMHSVIAGLRNANGQMLPKRNGPLSPSVTNGGSGGYTNANTTVTFSAPPAGGRQATGVARCYNGSVIDIVMTDYGDGYLGQTSYGASTLYTATITTTGAGTGATATVQAGLSIDGIHDNKAAQFAKGKVYGYQLAYPSAK